MKPITATFFEMFANPNETKHTITYDAFYAICKENGICEEYDAGVDMAIAYTHNYNIVATVHNKRIIDVKVSFKDHAQTVSAELIAALNKQINLFETMLPMLIQYTKSYAEVPEFMIPIMQDIFKHKLQ